MGLISTEVLVGLVGKTITFYEGKGYNLPKYIDSRGRLTVKRGTKIIVKVEDLMDNCTSRVEVVCDGCGEILTNIKWVDYLKCVKEDGKYYCNKCSLKLFGAEKTRKIKLKNGISFYQWCYLNLSKELADYILSRWDYDLNIDKNGNMLTPNDVSYSSSGFDKKGYWFKCFNHSEHGSELKNISSFTSGCKRSISCNKCNSISTTNPELEIYLVNKEDMFKLSSGSGKQASVKCPECGHKKHMTIPNLIRSGISCPKCGDNISYPEKFLFNVFEQLLREDFQTQLSKTTFKWCSNYKYDFYIDKINGIVCEAHGEQHYKESSFTSNRKTPLSEIQENDKNKEKLARENNIKNYIVLDCRNSTLEWIRNSIMKSDLPKLLDFNEEDIDWLKCHEYACSTLVKKACDLWNKGINNIVKIGEYLKLGKTSARRLLKQGVELGWCDYDPVEARKNKDHINIKVICLTTGEIFENMVMASKKYNINATSLSECCHIENKLAGRNQKTGEKLVFMYYEEYITKTEIQIKDIINNAQEKGLNKQKVICLTTGEIFESIKEAGEKYKHIDNSGIVKCCKGKQQYTGKHPETGKEMVWKYYNECL